MISRPRFKGELPPPVAERITKIRYHHGRIAWSRERLLSDPTIARYKWHKQFKAKQHAKIAEHMEALFPELARAADGNEELRDFLKGGRHTYISKDGRLTGTNMPRGKYPRMDNSALLGKRA